MIKILNIIGEYFVFLKRVFSKPEKWGIFFKKLLYEMYTMGFGSLLIVSVVSLMLGRVITIQSVLQIESNWIPSWTAGFIVRTSAVMELCPTIISLLLIGNLGSRITSEIGSMKVTEQVDALEVMGINSAAYLVCPKIVATIFVNPILTIIGIFCALTGGYFTIAVTEMISTYDFVDGLTYCFRVYDVIYSITKTAVFAFVMSSVSAFYGYRIEGGALELGKATTQGFVVTSVIVLILNVVITNIML